MPTYGNEDVRRAVTYYIVNVLTADPATYGWDYFDDVLDETGFNTHSTWVAQPTIITWTNVQSVILAAYTAYHYANDVLTPTEMKDHFTSLDSEVATLTTTVGGLSAPDLSVYVPKTTTVNGHALSGNIAITAADIGLSGTTSQYARGDGTLATFPTTQDVFSDGTTNKAYTATEKTKLAGIATSATANSSDATLLNRANHTGTESADVITDGSTNKAYTATEKTKLAGISAGATVNLVYDGTTSRAAPIIIYKTATVASGVATFQLTSDNTSTGPAIFPNAPILASVSPVVNDASASYQFGWAFSNSNKTLTITTNKLSTANILTGVLGQSAANGAVVNLTISGY